MNSPEDIDIRIRYQKLQEANLYPKFPIAGIGRGSETGDDGRIYNMEGEYYIWGRIFIDSLNKWWYGLIKLTNGNGWSKGVEILGDSKIPFAGAKPQKIKNGEYKIKIVNGRIENIEPLDCEF